jgi:alkylation response protein AidB-like acyl-CoA dehydrogenase
LFFGKFDSKGVIPYPSPPVDQAFLDKVAAFARDEIDPVAIDRNQVIPQEVKDKLAKMGVMGMTVPRQYGGLGMSQHEYCKVTEILASRCASTALYVNVHQSIGLKAILLFGTEEQKRIWLPAMARGEAIGAFALTEPNAGSDASAIETRAEYDPDKNVYRINGKKQWITNGSIAQVITLMARTDDGKITAFIVTPDMPGFKITNKSIEKMGYRGTWTALLEFHDMEVPAANLLGHRGKGLKIALTVLDYGRTTFGAICTGVAKFLCKKAVVQAQTRYQFGKPLGDFPLVKEKIAKMHGLAYAMDATTYLTAGLIDEGVEDIMLESTMLKVFASDSLWEIIYDTMQIYGGRCFFTEAPFERIMRDARLNMIGEGANEVMSAFIGAVGMRDVGMYLQELTTITREPLTGVGTIFGFMGHLANRVWVPVVPVKADRLQREAKLLGKAVRRLGYCVLRVLIKYREDVVDKQLDLDRISDAAIAIYTSTATISKLDSELTRVHDDTKQLGADVIVGKYYLHRAMHLLNDRLDHLFDREDYFHEKVSDRITGV